MELENQIQIYLKLLEDSLKKKSDLLNQIFDLSKEQEVLIGEETIDDDLFNRIIDNKDQLIQKIVKLDEGFDKIYQQIKSDITANVGNYQSDINRLQELIKTVTDKGIDLQVLEKRNKLKFEKYLINKRSSIKDFKISNKSATSYYKNMVNQKEQQSYFFDKKK